MRQRLLLLAAMPVVAAPAGRLPLLLPAMAILALVAWGFFLHLAGRWLTATARGQQAPADGDPEDEGAWKLARGLFALLGGSLLAVGMATLLAGLKAGLVADLFLSFALPPAMLILVRTRSLKAALSPGRIREAVAGTGEPLAVVGLVAFSLSCALIFLAFKLTAPFIFYWDIIAFFNSLGPEPDWVGRMGAVLEAYKESGFHQTLRLRLFLAVFAFMAAGMYSFMVMARFLGIVLYQAPGRLFPAGEAEVGGTSPGVLVPPAAASPLPFWRRLPAFMAFPRQHAPLRRRILLLAGLPGAGMLAGTMEATVVAVGVLSVITWLFLLHQAGRVFMETARGCMSPAEYSADTDGKPGMPSFSLLVLIFGYILAVGLFTRLLGWGAGLAANFFLAYRMPAVILVLVHRRSLVAAFNPKELKAVMEAMGRPYLYLGLTACVLSAAVMLLALKFFGLFFSYFEVKAFLHAAAMEPGWQGKMDSVLADFDGLMPILRPRIFLATIVVNGFGMYFTVAMAHLLGFVLYRHSARLFPPVPGREDERIAELMAGGQVEQALEIARAALEADVGNIGSQERYHRLLHQAGRDAELVAQAQDLLPLLLRRQLPDKALEVLRRCRERKGDFRPEDPAAVLDLALAARAGADPRLALDMLRSFDRLYPRHPLIPEVYFLSASILRQDLGQEAMAGRIFAALATRYPDHPRAIEADKYRGSPAPQQAASERS